MVASGLKVVRIRRTYESVDSGRIAGTCIRGQSGTRRAMIRWAKIVASELSALAVVVSLSWAVCPSPDRNDSSRKHFAGKLPITELNEQEAILHALNRLGFGHIPVKWNKFRKRGLSR